MSIQTFLDTFKGTIDLALGELAKVVGEKLCELIDEKKDELWEKGVGVALTKFDEDPEFNKSMIQSIADAVIKNIDKAKLDKTGGGDAVAAPAPIAAPVAAPVTGGYSKNARRSRTSTRRQRASMQKSRRNRASR